MEILELFDEGCQLFDAGKFWSAHEAWEQLWLPSRSLPEGSFYKGLIHYAAALVHLERGQRRGPRRLLRTAREHLATFRAACPEGGMGLDLCRLDSQITAFQIGDELPLPWPPPPLPRVTGSHRRQSSATSF